MTMPFPSSTKQVSASTPLQRVNVIVEEIDTILTDTHLNSAQRAGGVLPLLPKLLQAAKDLRDYHLGYRAANLRLSKLVSELLKTMLDSSTGELKWAKELPAGTIPSDFRRKVTELHVFFKQNPP